MATTHLYTIEAFEQLSEDDRVELMYGELHEMAPPSEDHNDVIREVVWRLENYIRPRGIEKLFIETTFAIASEPPSALIPDIAFVRQDRLDPGRDTSKLVRLAPDLVIEVISPSERGGRIREKINLYLAAGVTVVLLVDPARRSATIIRPDDPEQLISADGVIDLADVIPEFSLPLKAILK